MLLQDLVGLLHNASILLAFALIFEFFSLKKHNNTKLSNQILNGLLIGLVTVLIILTPWELSEGLVFDTRSVILSVAAYFFGLIPAIIAGIIAIVFRLYVGGDGTIMGVAVIISSVLVGIIWKNLNKSINFKNPFFNFLLMGYAVHFVMLLCMFLLPSDIRLSTFKNLIIPIISFYPLTTMLVALLLHKQKRNFENYKAKEKLHDTEQKLSKVLRSGNIISVIIDKNGSITYCNDYFLNLCGYEFEEIKGKNWFKLLIPEYDKKNTQSLFEKVKKNKIKNIDNINNIKTKNNEELMVSWNNAPIYDNNNNLTNVISIGVDITKTVKYENELLNKNKELNIAKEKALESNALKEEFIKNLSHEIRTPMNGIYGFVSLLEDGKQNKEKFNRYLKIIKKNTLQLSRIIEDLMEISKLNTKQIRILPKEVKVNEFLQDIYSVFSLKLNNPDIEISLNLPNKNKDFTIITDESKLNKIISNLIENAIKFTPKGNIVIGYKISNNKVQFYVKDSGAGIAKNNQEIIFDRFSRIEHEGVFNVSGLGLGLSIVKENTRLLKGEVELISKENEGSTFIISLPLKIS